MKLTQQLKTLAYASAALSIAPLIVSCDSDSSSSDAPAEPRIQFPRLLQSGDVITFDEVSVWEFTGAESFTSSGTTNTLDLFRSNTTNETFSISNAGITQEGGEATFEERLNTLLADFTSPIRTLPLERVQAGDPLSPDDLRTLADLINEEAQAQGEIIVTYDEENERILLSTSYDIDFEVTSGIGSFLAGEYSGTYSAVEEGYVIKFRSPTADERTSFRLTPNHRIPYVTNQRREIPTVIEGEFTWVLSATPPAADEPAVAVTTEDSAT